MKAFFATLLLTVALFQTSRAFDHTHGKFTALLQKHVASEGVRYGAFKEDHAELKSYLSDLAGVSDAKFKAWEPNQRLSYLINLYNAATVDLVLDHYPVRSFKDEIGGKDGPWKLKFVKALGSTYTLDEVEHQLIRENFAEPRIHFAVNCASVGCPPLRKEAFRPDVLGQQLEEQTKLFLANKDNNRITKKAIKLSPIFDWFASDFVNKSGSVKAFIDPYFPKESLTKDRRPIEYTNYSWDINKA